MKIFSRQVSGWYFVRDDTDTRKIRNYVSTSSTSVKKFHIMEVVDLAKIHYFFDSTTARAIRRYERLSYNVFLTSTET